MNMLARFTGSAVLSALHYFHLCVSAVVFRDLDSELFKNFTGGFSFPDH